MALILMKESICITGVETGFAPNIFDIRLTKTQTGKPTAIIPLFKRNS